MKNWTRYMPTKANKHQISLEQLAQKDSVHADVTKELKRRKKRVLTSRGKR